MQVNGQTRFATTAGSYESANDKRLHFGLGAAKSAKVEVFWPSGAHQSLNDVNGRSISRSARTGTPVIRMTMTHTSTLRIHTFRAVLAFCLAWPALAAGQTISPEASGHWNAARTAENQKQFDAAVTEYSKVTELEPTFPAGFVSLGQALMEKHDYPAAVAPLKHALELDSSLAPAHQLLGYALLAQGYAADAIPHLERVHEQAALGIAQCETGRFAEAIPNLQAALQKNPNDPDLLYYLGRASGLLSKQSVDTLLAVVSRLRPRSSGDGRKLFCAAPDGRGGKRIRRCSETAPRHTESSPGVGAGICNDFAVATGGRTVSRRDKATARKRRGGLSSG